MGIREALSLPPKNTVVLFGGLGGDCLSLPMIRIKVAIFHPICDFPGIFSVVGETVMQYPNSWQLHSMLRYFKFGRYLHLPKKAWKFRVLSRESLDQKATKYKSKDLIVKNVPVHVWDAEGVGDGGGGCILSGKGILLMGKGILPLQVRLSQTNFHHLIMSS